MVFAYPWSLLALAAVAAVAAWTLFRPGSQLAVVPSLRLWLQAAEALDRSARRSSRRVSASWLLLLIGAIWAVLATAGPILRSQAPSRRVTLALAASAELAAGEGMDELRLAGRRLIERLGPADRVQILLPAQAGQEDAGRWLSPAEAIRAVEQVKPLPLPAEELVFAQPAEGAQHVYRIGTDLGRPGGAGRSAGKVTEIVLRPRLGPATLDAAAARPAAAVTQPAGATQPAGGAAADQSELFVAVRNQLGQNWTGRVAVSLAAVEPDGKVTLHRLWEQPLTIEPRGRAGLARAAPNAAGLVVELEDGGPQTIGRQAFLARREVRRLKIALIGPDEPLRRRFVKAMDNLDLVAEPAQADLVFANGVAAPPGKPALVIAPPTAPGGWSAGTELADMALSDAAVDAADPLLRGVSLAGVAVRRVRPWHPGELTTQKVVIWLGTRALVLREEPRSDEPGARRVYVAFDLSVENTNFALSQAFPIFLANVVDYLAPAGGAAGAGGAAEGSYESLPPSQADSSWRAVVAGSSTSPLWPGLYKDAAGHLRAVSVVGLDGGSAGGDAEKQVAAAALSEPMPVGRQVELWPILLAAAMTAWLGGWILRVR